MALAVMRRHKRWLFVFLWLVILTFIILYIPTFQDVDRGTGGEAVARVGDLEITAGELRKAYLRQQDMYRRMYEGIDPAMLRQLGIDQQALESLVADRLVRLEARRLGVEVSDDELAHYLQTAPEFQDGGRRLSGGEIRKLLEMRGITETEFEEALRAQLLRDKLQSLITDGVVVSDDDVRTEHRRRTEKVKLEYVFVPAASFAAQQVVSDEDVKSRFAARPDDYRLPERRVLSYVLLGPEAMRSRVTLTDADLDAYFKQHADEFKQGEQTCASHVLVKVKATPEAPQGHPDAEARALAQKALDQLKAGADFAAVAAASSEDAGSKDNGGDLGCFGRGSMVAEFDAAAASLAPGQTSELVKTEFGYHIIRVRERRAETMPAFSQVKERIRATLSNQRAGELAEQQAARVSGLLADGKSLDETARELGLTVATSRPLGRADVSPSPLTPQVLVRAFELKGGETAPEPLPTPAGTVFVAVKEIQASRVPELKDVADRVRADLVKEKSLKQSEERAAALRATAETDGLEKAAASLSLKRQETTGLVGRDEPLPEVGPADLAEPVFALEPGTLSVPVRTPNGYLVARVVEKKTAEPGAFDKEKDTLVASLRGERQARLFQSFMNESRQRHRVEKFPDVYQRVVGS
jgi:peptidyl-prolyl cis-trans isomerase D